MASPDVTSLPAAPTPLDFDDAVSRACGGRLRAAPRIDVVQVNVGLRCNLACHHCHVESGPKRTEEMSRAVMERVLALAGALGARTIDVTGGAPEMHPAFRDFVAAARARGLGVMVRTNLVIVLEPGFEDLPDFFRAQGVHLVASLPCYLEENVDRQRGRNVYARSIEALRRLNAVGYGVEPELALDLVYNPIGPALPPPQRALEDDYRRELQARFGISFSRLYALANVPIGRFLHDLQREGRAEAYLALLRERFNPATVDGLMCRHQVHVDWEGVLHDCDFHAAVGIGTAGDAPRRIETGGAAGGDAGDDLRALAARLVERRVATAEHCFACTAGAGSSCGGALT